MKKNMFRILILWSVIAILCLNSFIINANNISDYNFRQEISDNISLNEKSTIQDEIKNIWLQTGNILLKLKNMKNDTLHQLRNIIRNNIQKAYTQQREKLFEFSLEYIFSK